MTFDLTDDERDLLRDCAHLLGYVIAHPEGGVDHLRTSRVSGSGATGGNAFAFHYTVRGGRISGSWQRAHVVERFTSGALAGSPSRMRFDEPHRHASITLTRLRRWAESLPDELRDRARVAWAVYPVNTRDLDELDRVVREAIELGVAPQLDLFGAVLS